MFKLSDFSKETAAKKQVEQLTEERSQIQGYAQMAGNLLGTLGNDLSGGPKFAYELLQNAHDTGSSKKPVSLYIYHEGDYLVWAHSGTRLFTPDDVEGISNAARSNEEEVDHKSKNLGMIGYKGIGFKAVLARADRIHIISGDFSFGFDQAESDKRLASYIRKNKSIRYLWQVLPFWMPIAGASKELLKNCHTAFQAFKPDFPEHSCPEPTTFFIMHIPDFNFKAEFSFLKKDLSWMMFLDNFSKMVFLNEKVCLARKVVTQIEHKLEIQLIHETQKTVDKNTFLIMSKEIVKTKEVDKSLRSLTDYQCPQRLRDARSTTVKIALALDDKRGLQALPAGQLFVGLPLAGEQDENQLVHIQANFLLDTRRYSLTDDGPWNSFLLSAAGYALVEFLAELAVTDEPYWNQTLNVLPKSWALSGVFYDGMDKALETIPFIPSNHNRKKLLTRVDAYLDATTSDYGTGFYYQFPKLPVEPMDDYYLKLPHRKLVNVDSELIENSLELSVLLETLDPEYFREEVQQIKLLTFLGEHDELLEDGDVLNKSWILNQYDTFSSLEEIYILDEISDQKGVYSLFQKFLELPHMVVAKQLPITLRNQLVETGCTLLSAEEYDNAMMNHLLSDDEDLEDRMQSFFGGTREQVILLTFLAGKYQTLSHSELSLLKSRKIIFASLPNEEEQFVSLEESYLPELSHDKQSWYKFCRSFFKLPEISVVDKLSSFVKSALLKLGCESLNPAEYDQRMCAYIFKHHANVAHLQKIFSTEERQVALITLLYNQENADNINSRQLSLLKTMSIFLDKQGEYQPCSQLFIALATKNELNQQYNNLLQLSELAVASRLSQPVKCWLSSELGIKEVSQADFESQFFNLMSSADVDKEKHLQDSFNTPEAQLTLLNFIASDAGDNHRAQIKEKSLVLVTKGKACTFVKPAEVFTLSDKLRPEDLMLISQSYPNLCVLATPITEKDKELYERKLGFDNLTPGTLARKLAGDIAKDYSGPLDNARVVTVKDGNYLILEFIVRYQEMIGKKELFENFRYLPLSTLSPEQLRPACFLYFPANYHPKDPVKIMEASEKKFATVFLNTDYIAWAKKSGISLEDLKKMFLALNVMESLTSFFIPHLSLQNLKTLEPNLAEEFIAVVKIPATVKQFKSMLHHPLLESLITGVLLRRSKLIDADTALSYLVKAWKDHWENKPANEGAVTDRYRRSPADYIVGFEFLRYAIKKLIPDLSSRYHATSWSRAWLPGLTLPENLALTSEQAQYLGLRIALDKSACELLLSRIPQAENKVAAQYYEHYKKVFKYLLTEQNKEPSSRNKISLIELRLSEPCYLLAEDDSWQPREKLSYLAIEHQAKPSPAYLKKWPFDCFSVEEQKKLAMILRVKVLEKKDLVYHQVPPLNEIHQLKGVLTEAGLPYLVLAKAQEEAKLLEETRAQILEKLTEWRFIQAAKIHLKALRSDALLQETAVYSDLSAKVFYMQAITTRVQGERIRNYVVDFLSELLSLKSRAKQVLMLILQNLTSEFNLDEEALIADMEEEGYNLAGLHETPQEIDATLAARFSKILVIDSEDFPVAAVGESQQLAVVDVSTSESQQAIGSALRVRKDRSRTQRSSSGGGFFGAVRAPDLAAEASPWQVGSREPRREDRAYSGDVEPISQNTWSSTALDDMKPNQLQLLKMPIAMIKTIEAEPTPGQLTIKLDRVEMSVIPPLPSIAVASQKLDDFLKTAMSQIQFSGLEDGIGYWGEALVYSWLLSQKYGSKFTEPVVYIIGKGHSVLTGTIKEKATTGEARFSRSYHMIWHREAGDRLAAHDITVVKTYETGEQKLTVHEVKTTKCSQAEASDLARGKVSRNQLSEIASYGNRYRLYRVYGAGQPGAELEYLRDPAALMKEGKLSVKAFAL